MKTAPQSLHQAPAAHFNDLYTETCQPQPRDYTTYSKAATLQQSNNNCCYLSASIETSTKGIDVEHTSQ